MQKKHDAQAVYYRLSSGEKLHQCRVCFDWTDKDPVDNGYKPADRPYPHHDRCPHKDKF